MHTRIVKEIVAGSVLVALEALLLYGHDLFGGQSNSAVLPTANHVHYAPVTRLASIQHSQNWAGYEVTADSYRSVSATWRIPALSSSRGVAAQWIGLGGVNSRELIQTGTIEQQTRQGPSADVFVEKLPNHAQNLMTVPIGASIAAAIVPGGVNQWKLTITARYQGQVHTKSVMMQISPAYARGIETSAEWIFEDPAHNRGALYPLATTQPLTFQNVEANNQPIGSASALIMTGRRGQAKVEPSMMRSGAFTVTDVRHASLRPYPWRRWRERTPVVVWQE